MTPASFPAQLAKECQRVGHFKPLWTQGPGSNLSFKDADSLWIKASGYRLDHVTEKKGVAKLKMAPLAKWLATLPSYESLKDSSSHSEEEKQYAALIKEASDPQLERASMEAGFHVILPKNFVAHFHSIGALLMAYEQAKNPENML